MQAQTTTCMHLQQNKIDGLHLIKHRQVDNAGVSATLAKSILHIHTTSASQTLAAVIVHLPPSPHQPFSLNSTIHRSPKYRAYRRDIGRPNPSHGWWWCLSQTRTVPFPPPPPPCSTPQVTTHQSSVHYSRDIGSPSP